MANNLSVSLGLEEILRAIEGGGMLVLGEGCGHGLIERDASGIQ